MKFVLQKNAAFRFPGTDIRSKFPALFKNLLFLTGIKNLRSFL
jgi:hypothetical protein